LLKFFTSPILNRGTSSTSNPRRYAVFLESLNLASNSPDGEQIKSDIMAFLESVNNNDYGVFDVLCHIALEILRRTAFDRSNTIPMNVDLRTTILQLIETLGGSFISTMLDTSDHLTSDKSCNIALYIAELALDQAIHMIQSERMAVENALVTTSRRKGGGALAVAKGLRLQSEANSSSIKEMLELSQQWAHVFEHLVIWKPASLALHSETPNVSGLDAGDIELVLRYWWLRGKSCQVQEEAKLAISWFQRCLKVYQSSAAGHTGSFTIDLNW
jgi:hypothetical protein